MRQDSIIWCSLASGVGLEGTRALITKDSIFVIDRINKEYAKYDFASLSQQLNFEVNFDLIQAVILGNMLKNQANEDEVQKLEKFFLISQNNGRFSIDNYIGRSSMKLERVEVNEAATNNNLVLTYNNFGEIDKFFYPYQSTYTIKYAAPDSALQQTDINLEVNKIEFTDKILKFPFNISPKYKLRQ